MAPPPPALDIEDGPATRATCSLARMDATEYMATLPDSSIDLILTDPPYMVTALDLDDAFDPSQYLRALRQMLRVLKPSGWLFSFGSLALHALTMQAFHLPRFDYIWIKHIGALPSHNVRRPHLKHEQIYAWAHPKLKRPADLYFDVAALRTYGHTKYGKKAMGKRQTPFREQMRHGSKSLSISESVDGSRHPTSLLYFPSKSGLKPTERAEHPTQKPVALCRTIVEGYCPPRGIVLDPFAGTGTTLLAARQAGRHGIGCEVNAEYWAMARDRGACGEPLFEAPPTVPSSPPPAGAGAPAPSAPAPDLRTFKGVRDIYRKSGADAANAARRRQKSRRRPAGPKP